MDLQLRGKNALVTGSSSGIGEAIAHVLAEEGAAVVVHGRRESEVRRVATAISNGGGSVAVALGDLGTDDAAASVARTAVAAFGSIDIVVNNAGFYVTKEWLDVDPAGWLDLYNGNVAATVRIIRNLLPQMRERGWGRFIQIAGTTASLPGATTAAYGATKAAIVNLTVSLAKSLARTGVTANAISPSAVLTPTLKVWLDELAREHGWQGGPAEVEHRFATEFRPNPSGRIARPEEVADLVAFIASPRAGYINGANLRVDGGLVPTTN